MSQSTALTAFQAIGNREDLTDVITNISPAETPMLSRFGKSKAKAVTHEWQTDSLATATSNAAIEGADYSFTRVGVRTRVSNWVQDFVNEVEVSDIQRAVDVAGVEDEFAYQMTKAMKEHARDIEYALVNGTGNSGASGTARTLKGVLAFMTTNVETGTGTSTSETLTSDMFNDALQTIWAAGGRPNEVYVNGFQKRAISGFTSPNTRNIGATEKEVVVGVDVLRNLGHVKLGQMLETPKALNAQSSSNATLIMVKSGRKFKGCNNGKSAGKVTRLVGWNNRRRGDDWYTDVSPTGQADQAYTDGVNRELSHADARAVHDGDKRYCQDRGRTSGTLNEQKITHDTVLANTDRRGKVGGKSIKDAATILVYKARQVENGLGIHSAKGVRHVFTEREGADIQTAIHASGSGTCITNESLRKLTSKILRDYTPGPECNSGDDIGRPRAKVRETGRNSQSGLKFQTSNNRDDSDFGRLKVILDRYMTTSVVAILQSDLWRVATLMPTRRVDVAKVGSATRAVVESVLTLEALNEAGSGQITGLATS